MAVPPSALVRLAHGTGSRGLTNLDHVTAPELDEHRLGQRLGIAASRVELELGLLGRLVKRVDAGEIADQPRPRLTVQTLWIARLAHFERRIHEDLDELSIVQQVARHAP